MASAPSGAGRPPSAAAFGAALLAAVGAALLAAVVAGAGAARAGSAVPGAPADPHAPDAPFAARITDAGVAALRVGGPDADAGVGDWVLGNGTVCAAVADADHEVHLSTRGGTLVDLGHCGGDDDQWSALQPLLNLSREWDLPVDAIRAERDDGEARIVVAGEDEGLALRTVFAVGTDAPDELSLRLRIERRGPGRRLFALAFVALHSSGQLRPFTLSLATPGRSGGFWRPPADPDSILEMARGFVPADVHLLVGSERIARGLAYGVELRTARLERADGKAADLPRIALGGVDYTLVGAVARPWWLGSADPPGYLQLAQMPFMDLAEGDALVFELVLTVGDRADVASIADRFWPDGARVTARLDDPAAVVHAERADGAPVTVARPDATGRVAFRLPRGPHRLRVVAPGGREVERALAVDGDLELGTIAVGAPGLVELPRDAGPMRLVFRGVDGTPDPRFGDDGLGFRVGPTPVRASSLASVVSLAGAPGDPETVTTAPGRYRVWATRGPEYDLRRAEITVAPGERVRLAIEAPARAIETPGWIAADLHVHSGQSFDSALPLVQQVRAFVAQGVEVLVLTEHDRVVDPGPAIARLGLGERIAGVPGVEITTTVRGGESPWTIGHSNAFPLPHRPEAYRGGAPRAEGLRLRDVAASLRALAPRPVHQLNHPRANDGRERADLYYFSHLAVPGEPFDPARPLDEAPNAVLLEPDPETGLRDLDLDAMELLNGTERGRYRLLRADWTSLWLQGERLTGTANSDSHHASETPGLPRNWVRVADDRAGALDPDAFVAAVRAGRVVGSAGPVLDVRLLASGAGTGDAAADGGGGAGVGDLFTGRAGVLRVDLRAAPWVPVDEVRVRVDGRLVERRAVAGPARFALPLRFEADAFVTVEAEGAPRGAYTEVLPGLVPLAFTNPIRVDADGDGRWTAPGLPDPLPDAIEDVRP